MRRGMILCLLRTAAGEDSMPGGRKRPSVPYRLRLRCRLAATKNCWLPKISPTMRAIDVEPAHRKALDSLKRAVPATYPRGRVTRDGKRAFVALWNASEIVGARSRTRNSGAQLALLKPASPSRPAHIPANSPSRPTRKLYVALPIVTRCRRHVSSDSFGERLLRYALPGQSYFGASRWLSPSTRRQPALRGKHGTDSVAVFETSKLTRGLRRTAMVEPDGFIPTEWMPIRRIPSSLRRTLYLATGQRQGTGPTIFLPPC